MEHDRAEDWDFLAANSRLNAGDPCRIRHLSRYLGVPGNCAPDGAAISAFNEPGTIQNSASCPLTLANGFPSTASNGLVACSGTTADTFAIDPNFRIGYAQAWQLAIQRDLPFALQMTATYQGTKETHGPQEILPNSYPLGAANPCPSCPSGFVYENSERQLDPPVWPTAIAAQAARRIGSVAYVHLFEVDRRRRLLGRARSHDGEQWRPGAISGSVHAVGGRGAKLARSEGRTIAFYSSTNANCSACRHNTPADRDSMAAHCWGDGAARC